MSAWRRVLQRRRHNITSQRALIALGPPPSAICRSTAPSGNDVIDASAGAGTTIAFYSVAGNDTYTGGAGNGDFFVLRNDRA